MGIIFNFKDWNDWIADITPSSDFEFTDLPGFVVKATEGIYYDHSDLRNPTNLSESDFPKIYKDKNWSRGVDYTGLFIKSLRMKLPKDFVGNESNNIDFGFEKMFIDKHGVSTIISANDVLTAGSVGGWAFSINSIYLEIEANNFKKDMGMKGKIGFPLSTDQLNYECHLNTESNKVNYLFSVMPPENGLNIPMWAAKFKLAPESAFTIKSDSKGTAVMTDLAGKIDISIKDPIELDFTAMSFQGFKLGNRHPDGKEGFYFDAGNIDFGSGEGSGTKTSMNDYRNNGWDDEIYYANANGPSVGEYYASSASEQLPQKKINGFGVTIDNVDYIMESGGADKLRLGFKFDLEVDLAFGSSIGLAGTTSIVISGLVNTKKYIPDGLETPGVERVAIYGAFGNIVTVDASMEFINDGTRGKGVDGSGKVSFMPGIEVDARVLFGTAPAGYTYYGFGAAVYASSGLIPLGPILVTGFGGGFFHNMKMETIKKEDLSKLSKTGVTAVKVSPQNNSNVFIASVGLAYINTTVVKAKIDLKGEIINDALTKLTLVGKGAVFSAPDMESPGIVDVNVNMTYDFVHDAFDMYFGAEASLITAKVSIPVWIHSGYNGSVPPNEDLDAKKVRLSQKNNFNFFLYLGYPNEGVRSLIQESEGSIYNRIKLVLFDINSGPIKAYLGADGYFCIGTILPDFPDLPSEIRNFLGGNFAKEGSDNMVNNLIKGGGNGPSGFMFGASATGRFDIDLFIIRAYASAIVGFDVALVHTTGGCGTQSQIGLEGWYAVGQVYAYLKMGVDLHIDVGLFSGDITLAKVQIGAALMGGMPNPVWLNGKVRIVGEALGGLVHVNQSFVLEIGQKCMPALDPLEGIKLISEVGPGTDNVNVFDKPYVIFNLPMDKRDFTFSSMDNNGDEVVRTYQFFMKDYQITTNKGNVDQGKPIYSSDGYSVTFYSDTALSAKTKYTIKVTCQAKEFVRGAWVDPINNKNKSEVRIQSESATFTTGKRPNILEEKHVVINYPLSGQRYFLKNQFPGKKGKVVINQYVSDYMKLEGVSKPLQKVVFVPQYGSGSEIKKDFILVNNAGKYSFEFDIPTDLQNSKTYLVFFTLEDPAGDSEKTTHTSERTLGTVRPNSFSRKFKNNNNVLRNKYVGEVLVQKNEPIDGNVVNTTNFKEGYNLASKEVKLYRPAQGRVIYKMLFRTSKFNTFSEKIASFGNSLTYGATEEEGSAYDGIARHKWTSFSLNFGQGGEYFDEYEIKGVNKRVGEGSSAFSYFIPPLLNAKMAFDKTKSNDNEMEELYGLSKHIKLAFLGYDIKYSNYTIRTSNGRPDYTINLSHSPSETIVSYDDFVSGNIGRRLSPFSSRDRLTLFYERDKYFFNDLAMIQGAYYTAVLLAQPLFDVRYAVMQANEDYYQYLYKAYEALTNLDYDAANNYYRMYEEAKADYKTYGKLTDELISDYKILFSGPSGTVGIRNGFEESFWINHNAASSRDLILDISYKLFPGIESHNIVFNYGFDTYHFNSYNNGGGKGSAYFRILDFYQKSDIIPYSIPKINYNIEEQKQSKHTQPFIIPKF